MTYAWYCPKCRTTAIDEQITFTYPGFSGGRRHADCGTLLEFINNGEDVLSYSPLPTSPQESGDSPLRDAEAIAATFTADEVASLPPHFFDHPPELAVQRFPSILYEYRFGYYIVRVIETEPGIVHFEQARCERGDPSVMKFERNYSPHGPMGCANEMIQLNQRWMRAMARAEDAEAACKKLEFEKVLLLRDIKVLGGK